MTTWIRRFEDDDQPAEAGGLRVAVKDAIDVAGVPTTNGCPAVADTAEPAAADAACLRGVRAAGARIVGKANLHELCYGISGVNPWYGTPVNPLDPERIPGGSSSGSAVAVATGEADVGFGTDTGGSVRIPAACCGLVGLKTTWGRVPLDGVWPLAPSLDTVGPIAADVAGVVAGMQLLEPGFAPAAEPVHTAGRLRVGGVDPVIDEAIDAALAAAGVATVDVDLPGWDDAANAFMVMIAGEAARSLGHLLERRDRVSDTLVAYLEGGMAVTDAQLEDARATQRRWRATVDAAVAEHGVLALPTLAHEPPTLDDPEQLRIIRLTPPFNLSGHPVVALPVPFPAGAPARTVPPSLQLVGPRHGEEVLVATAAHLASAL